MKAFKGNLSATDVDSIDGVIVTKNTLKRNSGPHKTRPAKSVLGLIINLMPGYSLVFDPKVKSENSVRTSFLMLKKSGKIDNRWVCYRSSCGNIVIRRNVGVNTK